MEKLGLNKKECEESLKHFVNAINEIIQFWGSETHLSRSDKSIVQSKLRILKSEFKLAYDSRSTIKGSNEMSRFEAAFFYPAIHESMTKISVRVNSQPDEKWQHELYSAQYILKCYLRGLNEYL